MVAHTIEGWESVIANRLVLPAGWRCIASGPDGGAYGRRDGLKVISSACREPDGKRWQHVSVSRPDRLPSWQDLRDAKDVFMGPSALALQVLPPEKEYVNTHPFCLHLYRCVDERPVPDFRKLGTI